MGSINIFQATVHFSLSCATQQHQQFFPLKFFCQGMLGLRFGSNCICNCAIVQICNCAMLPPISKTTLSTKFTKSVPVAWGCKWSRAFYSFWMYRLRESSDIGWSGLSATATSCSGPLEHWILERAHVGCSRRWLTAIMPAATESRRRELNGRGIESRCWQKFSPRNLC